MALTEAQRSRARRPFFRRGMEYVYVKPVRLGSDRVAQPGDEAAGREFHLRSLYQRRLIGMLDDPWTEHQLAAWDRRRAAEAARRAAAAVPDTDGGETDHLPADPEQLAEADQAGDAAE